MTNFDFDYKSWPSGEPYDWAGASRGDSRWAAMDFHVDLGCGTIKKGRIGVDQFDAPGVDVVMNLNTDPLPFPDSSIESIITHHCLEHISTGFVALIDEIYRVLKPDGIFYAITPLFPSRSAVDDPTHVRLFTEGTWRYFMGRPGADGCWQGQFSVLYTQARFEEIDQDVTARVAAEKHWTDEDAREMRVVLKAVK